MSTPSRTDEFKCLRTGLTCTICQEDFIKKDIIWTIRYCAHTFHKSCIEPWAAATCPVCRIPYLKPIILASEQRIHCLKKTATFAFAIKIVRTCSLDKFMNELPTIRQIIQDIRLDGHALYKLNLNTYNLHTFYESYMQLRHEMCELYNHNNYDDIHLLNPIQHITWKLIKYEPLRALITRCNL